MLALAGGGALGLAPAVFALGSDGSAGQDQKAEKNKGKFHEVRL
jgi:hypothetical protein